MTVFVGEIRLFAGITPPADWAFCNGQMLLRSAYPELYDLIGTTFGSDGITTFALPDLRSRFPLSKGELSGITYQIGDRGGQETVTLSPDNIISHNHQPRANTGGNPVNDPAGRVWTAWTGAQFSDQGPTANQSFSSVLLESTGGGQAHENIPPYLAIRFMIALKGYPVSIS